jgi:hypothetical protein
VLDAPLGSTLTALARDLGLGDERHQGGSLSLA